MPDCCAICCLLLLLFHYFPGTISITKSGGASAQSIHDILIAKAAGKGITITKGGDTPANRTAASAGVTAVPAKTAEVKVEAPKAAVNVEKKAEAVAPQVCRELHRAQWWQVQLQGCNDCQHTSGPVQLPAQLEQLGQTVQQK